MFWMVYGPSIPIILMFGLSDGFPLWTTAALGLPLCPDPLELIQGM